MIEQRIEKFLSEHNVLTLASLGAQGEPYCSNVFYVYLPSKAEFVFTSSEDTRHGQDMMHNSNVAASVVLDSSVVGKLRGVQISGTATRTELAEHKSAYLKKYPFASLSELTLWVLRADFMKFTDNRLGFGKKLIWNRR